MRLTIFAPSHLLDGLSACLFDAGAGGLEEGPSRLCVYGENEAALEVYRTAAMGFAERISVFEPDAEFEFKIDVPDESWQSTWQEALGPVQITSTWVLRPTHCQPAPKKEKTLWFKPEASFGSGEHATTRLAAEYLEQFVQQHQITEIFDVGTGTGVLAMVAAKAGATRIFAVDNDRISVDAARHNIELNQLEANICIEEGSAGSATEKYPLVVANINTHILVTLAQDLCTTLSADGTLVLTGLLEEDIPELVQVFQNHGVELSCHSKLDGWALLHGQPLLQGQPISQKG